MGFENSLKPLPMAQDGLTPFGSREWEHDSTRPEFWRMDAVGRKMPGFRKLIKAPPMEKSEEEPEESEE